MDTLSIIFNTLKTYFNYYIEVMKTNTNYKLIGICALIGLITFSAWSAFMYALIIGAIYYLLDTRAHALITFLPFNVKSVTANIVSGFILASLILLIF